MKRATIIHIIDDDRLFVFLTKKCIESTKIPASVKEFGDGQLALDYLANIQSDMELLPDIILLDLSMPVMDGWEFLNDYTLLAPKINKKIKLYILSSSISPHDMERAKNINSVTDFIVKPLSGEKFAALISS